MLRVSAAFAACSLLLSGCSTLFEGPRLDEGSQARFEAALRGLKMPGGDIAAIHASFDPSDEDGPQQISLPHGQSTLTLGPEGWQGCRSLLVSATFSDTGGAPVDAKLSGMICPAMMLSDIRDWHLARIQVISPLPPEPPPEPPSGPAKQPIEKQPIEKQPAKSPPAQTSSVQKTAR